MLIPNDSKTSFDYKTRTCYIPNDCPYIEVNYIIHNLTAIDGESDYSSLSINDRGKQYNVEIPIKLFCDLTNLSCKLNELGVYVKHYHSHDLSSMFVSQTRDLALKNTIEYR